MDYPLHNDTSGFTIFLHFHQIIGYDNAIRVNMCENLTRFGGNGSTRHNTIMYVDSDTISIT